MFQGQRVLEYRAGPIVDEDEAHLELFVALLVVFVALECLVALLFITVEDLESPLKSLSYTASEEQAISTSDGLPSLLQPLAATSKPEGAIALLDQDVDNNGNLDGLANSLAASKSEVTVNVLDQDLDNDGNPDGLTDPLVVVEVLLVLTPLVSVSLLLALYELPKLFSIWLPLLERPG